MLALAVGEPGDREVLDPLDAERLELAGGVRDAELLVGLAQPVEHALARGEVAGGARVEVVGPALLVRRAALQQHGAVAEHDPQVKRVVPQALAMHAVARDRAEVAALGVVGVEQLGHGLTRATAPPVRATSSAGAIGKTCCGVPADAHTSSYCRRSSSTTVSIGAGCPIGATPPIA